MCKFLQPPDLGNHTGVETEYRFFSQLIEPVILIPEKYGVACAGFDASKINAFGLARDLERSMLASMMLTYLHELGHHVLGHVNSIPDSLNNARQLEAAADAWAIEIAYRSGFNVLDGMPALNLIAALNAGNLGEENTLTHPHGLNRIREMTDHALDILISQRKTDIAGSLNSSLQRIELKMPGS